MSKFSVAMKRFGGFLKRNAFYFLIVLCIASVATVIALAVTRNNGRQDPTLNVDNNQTVLPENPDDTQKPDDGGNQNQDDPATPNDPSKPDENDPGQTEKKLTFIKPCNGSVLKDCDLEELVYSSTMQDWAVHSGVDFTSDDLNVYAAADGTVSEAAYDELNGYYIVIAHEDGYQTIYKSLEGTGDFKAGDKITQGTLLGKMSDSQGEEMLDGAHLHFEMTLNGENIDPFTMFVNDEK